MAKNKNRKIFTGFYFDLEKEEKWVNSICQKGWKLERIILGIFFIFSKCEPDEYEVKYYFTGLKDQQARRDFVKEWGYDIIPHGSDLTPWLMYLVRRKSDDSAEITSDIASKLEDYKKRRKMFTILGTIFAVIAFFELLELLIISIENIITFVLAKEADAVLIALLIIVLVVFSLTTFAAVVSLNIRRKLNMKIKAMEKESIIYQ